jgi:hypothetical protein
MESIIGAYINERNSRGHDLYAVVEEENDQIIGIVDVVVDKVLLKAVVYEVIISRYLRQSDYVSEIFVLLDHKYLEHDGNNFIEININDLDNSLEKIVVATGFEENGIVRSAWRNRSFEYGDSKLFRKQKSSSQT